MTNDLAMIRRGSLLVADGTAFPPSIAFESAPCTSGWRLLLRINSQEMKSLMAQTGWHFFYIATERKATVWGWNKVAAVEKALRRITARADVTKYNCLEIKEVDMRQRLGVSFVRVTARSRQIREPIYLNGEGSHVDH